MGLLESLDDPVVQRRVGTFAWAMAWVGLVVGQLHALARFATADGREDLELPWTRAWAEPAADLLAPLLEWGDPDLVYFHYGKVWFPVFVGFTLAGFLTLLVPQELIARWLGEGSGIRGVLAGTLAGALTPGGPFTHFPILASLMAKGAAVGPVCAYISAWALIGVHRIVIWEAPILGWKFVAVRLAASFLLPPVAGLAAMFLWSRVRG